MSRTQTTIPRDALAALRTRFLELVREDPIHRLPEWPGPLHASGYVRVAVGQRHFSGARLAWLLLRPHRPISFGDHARHGCAVTTTVVLRSDYHPPVRLLPS